MFSRAKPGTGDAMTLIGEEACFRGTLAAKGSLRVEGVFEGDVTDAAEVQIGARGRVLGNVAAEVVVVAGELRGNVSAGRSLELLATARVRGDVRTPVLRVDEGARLDGSCAMETDSKEAAAAS